MNCRARSRSTKVAVIIKATTAVLVCIVPLSLHPLADAQQPGKVFRIGFLDQSTASGSAVLVQAFRQELNKFGWVEGKNIVIEHRFAEQKNDDLPQLAAELVRLKVDLIVVAATPAAVAAKNATKSIPIVMTTVADPIGAGLIHSLAQPGGNVTGRSSLSPELNSKRLEVLKDAIPKISRVGFLRSPSVTGVADLQLQEIRPAALALNLKLEEIETQLDFKGLESAFESTKRKHVHAIMPMSTRGFFAERKRIVELTCNIDSRPSISRRSLSKKAASCPTARTSTTSFAVRLSTWTRF